MHALSNHDRLRSAALTWSLILLMLAWRPAFAASGKTAADYFVHTLPGAPQGPLLKMHAGHIEVTPEDHGNLFFWHFENRHIGDRPRTVIWLNGGPGCSSMDGAMMEVGPYRTTTDGNLEYNNGSWNEFANLLFVDQPVGTGFSYVDTNKYIHELDVMADQFLTFLEHWMDIFPQYMHDDLYIAGESYAGQHIPYIAKAILARNGKGNGNKQPWNLKGLLIGNGWISGKDQYPAYLKFAYQNNMLEPGTSASRAVEAAQGRCLPKLEEEGNQHVDVPECEDILQEILRQTLDKSKPKDQQCYNMYDVRLRDSYSSCGMNWPPDLTSVTPYLRRREVRNALHIDPQEQAAWQECNGAVGSAFTARNSPPSITLLPDILQTVPIVLFSGDKDLICNHIGTENLIKSMSWNGGTGFELSPDTWAPRRPWTFEGEPAGIYQEARNLTYVLFYNSSHMVPFDYPRRTRDMLDRFMGVDIGSIGGAPGDSRIDGEKAGPETSVGGHPNSSAAEEEQAGRVKQAEYNAYYKSGEVVLVIVVIAAGAWGWWVWKERRRQRLGYRGLGPDDGRDHGMLASVRDAVMEPHRLEGFRNGKRRDGDLEAADFDENELDEMVAGHDRERRYDVGSDSDDDDARHEADGLANGHGHARA